MEKQATSQNSHWMNMAEVIAGIGSVGAAFTSIVINQAALASIPLSFMVVLNLANRRRLLNEMEQGQQSAIAQLIQENQAQQNSIEQLILQEKEDRLKIAQLFEQSQAHQTSLEILMTKLAEAQKYATQLDAKAEGLQDYTQSLDQKQQQLQEFTAALHAIETYSRSIQAEDNTAAAYFERGAIHQKLGDLQVALRDYTAAIQLNPNHAAAYFNRGAIRAQLDDKQGAIQDLRAATNLYFEQGDLVSYQNAKDLSKQIHDLDPTLMREEPTEAPGEAEQPAAAGKASAAFNLSALLESVKTAKSSKGFKAQDSEALLVGNLFN